MLSPQKIIAELSDLIAFPSVSSDSQQMEAVKACAAWLVQHLQSIGMQRVRLYETSSHPVVVAEYTVKPSLQTILFYGHYDVQPVDPLGKWLSYPFKAKIKGDYIYGRGSSDDKGQFFIHIKAIERLLKKYKELPVNVKFLIEGSEEIGSKGLKEFILLHKELLRCDVAVVSDTKMASIKVPAITYSLRGSLNAEIFIQSSNKDLHSGTFGGSIPNAALILAGFLSKLHNINHAIAIPGFYDDVTKLTDDERSFMKLNGPDNEKLLYDAEVKNDWGEENYTMYERTTIRPSLSITGITSGFQGKGVKNVIPSVASAKINFRLVSRQRPEKIQSLFDRHLLKILPSYVMVQTIYSSFSNPVMVSRENRFITAAIKAYENVFKQKVKLIRSGGTIAAVEFLSTLLNIPVVLMGFAQVSDNMHAPNERMYLPNFFKGIDTSIGFIINVSKLNHQTTFHAATHY